MKQVYVECCPDESCWRCRDRKSREKLRRQELWVFIRAFTILAGVGMALVYMGSML